MKIKGLLIGMLACTALVGCTNSDEPEVNGENKFDGDKAYVVVNIKSAEGLGSRGEAGEPALTLGTENEIKSANFYFYSAEGTYVTEGAPAVEKDGTYTPTNGAAIELKTKTVVVLNDLAQKGTPKYVLVVLNKPTSCNLTGKSIAEVKEVLLGALTTIDKEASITNTVDNNKYFIMTNSTYNSTTAVDHIGYFATAIDESQFKEQPIASDLQTLTPVEIYVERLAAKVELSLASNANKASETTLPTDGTYLTLNKITTVTSNDATLAGSEKQYYAKIEGWSLNGTNKQSYLMKNVPAWNENLNFTWSDPTNWRSYWAHSWNYGDDTLNYPETFAASTKDALNQEGTSTTDKGTTTAAEYPLDYTKWSALNTAMGTSEYCAENTNTKTILETKNFHSATTEILLAATIVDEKGTEVELFRYDNVLYDRANYLERLFAKVSPNVWKATTSGEGESAKTEYTQISSEDLKETIVNEGDGRVSVTFAFESAPAANVWYQKNADETFTAYVAEGETTLQATIEKALNTAFKTLFDKERDPAQTAYVLAEHYNDGMMYYNIPIEHLYEDDNNVANNPYTNGKISVAEAEYGVVRNHWYQVSINKIENLGSAVHDANEDIIPNKEENVLYYVAARINILSWKIVNQSVDL